jgi:hypothetical protein
VGIEPTQSAWKAEVLPLNYARFYPLQKHVKSINLLFLLHFSLCFPHLSGFIFLDVEGEGFEPSKAEPVDLQSTPFGHFGIHPRADRRRQK